MDFQYLQKADQAAFALELAKKKLELAKSALEAAKISYEDVMSSADEQGVSKGKLKKIVEERVREILADEKMTEVFQASLPELAASSARDIAKADKPKRSKKTAAPEVEAESEAEPEFSAHPDASEEFSSHLQA